MNHTLDTDEISSKPRPHHRPVVILFVLMAASICCLLAYWQWTRWDATGSFQNLGYVVQWPLIAGFFIYTYQRFIKLEAEQEKFNDITPPGIVKAQKTARPVSSKDAPAASMTEIPDGLLPSYKPPPTTEITDSSGQFNTDLRNLNDSGEFPKQNSRRHND